MLNLSAAQHSCPGNNLLNAVKVSSFLGLLGASEYSDKWEVVEYHHTQELQESITQLLNCGCNFLSSPTILSGCPRLNINQVLCVWESMKNLVCFACYW